MRKFRGIPLSLAAAIAAASLSAPPAALAPAAPGVTAQQDGTKTVPVQSTLNQVGDLAFLDDVGAPKRFVASGCPWPGNRAACARRSAGKVRRMR